MSKTISKTLAFSAIVLTVSIGALVGLCMPQSAPIVAGALVFVGAAAVVVALASADDVAFATVAFVTASIAAAVAVAVAVAASVSVVAVACALVFTVFALVFANRAINDCYARKGN